MEKMRKYRFDWDLIGDIQSGRPNLGNSTRIESYRLMQFCFRDVIEKRVGPEETDRIFWEAGLLAGKEFFNNMIKSAGDFNDFVSKVQHALLSLKIGVLRIEKAAMDTMSMVITVSEDLDCSGLPDIGTQVCNYDEGFIAGLLEAYTGKQWCVREIDCWCNGDRTCRFSVELKT
ncbi:MAG: 4-vinyl reductase [Syntrophales bacterium]